MRCDRFGRVDVMALTIEVALVAKSRSFMPFSVLFVSLSL